MLDIKNINNNSIKLYQEDRIMNQVELPSESITRNYSEQAGMYYYLKRSNRKSLEVAVLPNQDVEITAPLSSPLEAIELILLKRKDWIKNQQKYFRSFGVQQLERNFVNGETHYFLGRKYRLKLLPGDTGIEITPEIEKNRYITIYTRNTNKEFLEKVFQKWLKDQAKVIFEELLEECWSRFIKITGHTKKPDLVIRKLKRNWGTMRASGLMTLNIRLIQTTRNSIKYIINHELCHLIHMNHSKKFYLLQERVNPGWQQDKYKLERTFSS